ncbi:DUF3558 family protein [Nocardia takedensis]
MSASCADDSSDATTTAPSAVSSTTSASTSPLQAQVGPAPDQSASDRVVRFDPCVAVADDLVRRAGFDPATRERSAGEVVTDLLTTIGCSFDRFARVAGEDEITGSVTIESTTMNLAEIRSSGAHAVFDAEPIAGREAILYTTQILPGSCSAAITTTDGVFRVGLVVYPASVPLPAACDEIRSTAAVFAESLE